MVTTACAAILGPVRTVLSSERATRSGGVTGRGFRPGESGNPGGHRVLPPLEDRRPTRTLIMSGPKNGVRSEGG